MLGLPNTRSYFNDVVQGKKITTIFVERFILLFKLNPDEARYFRILVKFNQAETIEEHELYFDQLIALNRSPSRTLDKKELIYYRHWYNSVIRALLNIIEFKGDYAQLSRMVYPEITAGQARESVKLMLDLGLIVKNDSGVYRPTESAISTPDFIRDDLVRQYQLAVHENARLTIMHPPKECSIIATNVISMSSNCYKQIEKAIKKFRSEIRSLVHKDDHPADRVFQLNLYLYPNSKKL
jgi:uncharacterized protein (TIGR02147 family)